MSENGSMTPEEIKALRTRLRMTQQDLAVRLGVSLGTVTRWETGGVRPSKLALAALQRLDEETRQ